MRTIHEDIVAISISIVAIGTVLRIGVFCVRTVTTADGVGIGVDALRSVNIASTLLRVVASPILSVYH
jgi:hypothetical protein